MSDSMAAENVERVAWLLIHFIWQGAALALIAFFALTLIRHRSPQLRYWLSMLCLVGMAFSPIMTWMVLSRQIPDQSSMTAVFTEVTSAGSDKSEYSLSVYAAVVVVWLIGVVGMSLRLVLGQLNVWNLARQRAAAPEFLLDMCRSTAQRLGMRRPPIVALSRNVTQAVAIRLIRPIVLVPMAWATELPADVLRSVIAHELAHVRRFDLWFNLVQRVIETTFFYHPAVWWLSQRVRLEREMCCDSEAVLVLGQPVEYARALELVAHKRVTAVPAFSTAIGGSRMHLLQRVQNVLGLRSQPRIQGWHPVGFVMVAAPAVMWLWMSGANPVLAQEERSNRWVETELQERRILKEERQRREDLEYEQRARRSKDREADMERDERDQRDERYRRVQKRPIKYSDRDRGEWVEESEDQNKKRAYNEYRLRYQREKDRKDDEDLYRQRTRERLDFDDDYGRVNADSVSSLLKAVNSLREEVQQLRHELREVRERHLRDDDRKIPDQVDEALKAYSRQVFEYRDAIKQKQEYREPLPIRQKRIEERLPIQRRKVEERLPIQRRKVEERKVEEREHPPIKRKRVEGLDRDDKDVRLDRAKAINVWLNRVIEAQKQDNQTDEAKASSAIDRAVEYLKRATDLNENVKKVDQPEESEFPDLEGESESKSETKSEDEELDRE